MTLDVRTRSQASRMSSEPSSPEAKRNKVKDDDKDREVSDTLSESPKTENSSIEGNREATVTPKSYNENEPNPIPETHNLSEEIDNGGFPSLYGSNATKKEEHVAFLKSNTPEVIQIDDESSSTASETPQPASSLPNLTSSEAGLAGEKKQPTIRRRRRRIGGILQPSQRQMRFEAAQRKINARIQKMNNRLSSQIFPQNNVMRKPLTPIWNMIVNFPKEIANNFEPFQNAMCQWQWEVIDNIPLPVILRGTQKFVAYSIAHIKLFSKFPTNVNLAQNMPADVIPENLAMTETEAWMMNFINTVVCNYELGMQVFQNSDTLVEFNAIELYYLFAKKHYLEELLRIYDGAVPPEALNECKNIIGAIHNLKKTILDDVKKINEQIKIKYRPQNQSQSFYSSSIQRQQNPLFYGV